MKATLQKLKQDNYEAIFVSLMTIIIGIIMIIYSTNVLNMISYLMGGILIINGLLKIFYYFKYEGKYNIFNYDLSFGILNIILGIFCLIFKSELQSIFRLIIGLIVIYEGILNITLATKILYVDKPAGFISILLSLLMILSGGLIVLVKGIVIETIGYILILFAIMNIVECLIFHKNLNKISKYLSSI